MPSLKGREWTVLNDCKRHARISFRSGSTFAMGGPELVLVEVAPSWTLYTSRRRWGLLAVLFIVSTSNYVDRNVISVVLEPIKHEFHVSDTLLGLLGGFCFSLFYALFGMPVAQWADRGNRRTIVALALTVWSVMTVACGLVTSFWQLALARVGVGAGESGALPPAQSLIADYFPPDRWASAIAIFTAASTVGHVVGFAVGGYIAAMYGWRSTFILVGAPGLLLAIISRFGLDEPRLRRGFPAIGANRESVRETLTHLAGKRGFLYALAGCILYFLMAYGALAFIPSFLIRALHVPLAKVSVTYGAVAAIAGVVGTLSGGWFADRLGRRDIRWLAWLPAAACALAGPLFEGAITASDFRWFLAFAFAALMVLGGGLPSVFAAIHAVCGSKRRATAIAIVLFAATLFGGGFGPLITGALSDALTTQYGTNGLRYSLMCMMSVLMPSAGLFFLFGRAMPADLED
jgi:predicted MFS family arabinose efflux permease